MKLVVSVLAVLIVLFAVSSASAQCSNGSCQLGWRTSRPVARATFQHRQVRWNFPLLRAWANRPRLFCRGCR